MVSPRLAAPGAVFDPSSRHARDVHLPVPVPGLTAVQRALALPVGAAVREPRPGQPGPSPPPALVVPVAEQVDLSALEAAAPHREPARRRVVRPRMFPAARGRVERAQPEALDDGSPDVRSPRRARRT